MNRLQMATTVTLFLTGLFLHSTLAAGGWGYEGPTGPSFWGKSYKECDKDSQSPINIYEGDVSAKKDIPPFVYKNYDTAEGLLMSISNNGHGAVISLSGSNLPEISGGGLDGVYQAAQFHLHWDGDEKMGSEHKISSEGFPGELHIVHFKKNYGTVEAALTKADGLAVLGFMLEISASGNSNYDGLLSAISKITKPDNAAVELAAQTMNSYLPQAFNNFYRYSGSLTTPPCYETVTWTVFKETIKMSRSQIATFLDLKDDEGQFILHNARPVQPINGRSVIANYDPAIHWGYVAGHYDPAHWADYYESCGGQSQSPVNIPSGASTLDNTLTSFVFNGFDSTTGIVMKLFNNGHTVKVGVTGSPAPSVTGGSLPEKFVVAQFHFHWGATSMKGSEHTVDAKSYPMEIHVVTYKSSLGSLGDAAKESEGLAVLGFFFEISEKDNPSLDPILNLLTSVVNPNQDTALTPITLDSILPTDRSEFYRYPGSLTTPGCYQSVIWTVFNSKINVSEAQMAKLRVLKSSEKDAVTNTMLPMVDNYRPVQFLNSRVIRRNFEVTPPPKTKWTYFGNKGTQNWNKYFPQCASDVRQSPINIMPRSVEIMNFPKFEFTKFDTKKDVSLKIKNNGHSVTVSYVSGGLQVSGGGLEDTYKVAQFHFHWGSVNTQGSEHTIDGTKYPMELHIVMYNQKYASVGLAMTQGNGLAVLGFMLQVTDDDNPKLNTIVNRLSQIKNPNAEVSLSAFTLDSILPKDKNEFFRYDGSLTTPTCDESVTWTVFYSTIAISEKQLNVFRGLDSSEMDDKNNVMPMVDNYRPVQPIGGRTVYSNFYLSGAPSRHTTAPAVASVIFTIGKLAWSFH